MIPAGVSEIDRELVALCWHEALDFVDPTDEDRALAAAMATVEAERREAEWRALELIASYASPVTGRVERNRWPESAAEQVRLVEALMLLGWSLPVPIGRAEEAGCQ